MTGQGLGMSTRTLRRLPRLEESGSILRREAMELGLSPEDIRRLVDKGVWLRIRRGTYVERESWGRLAPEQQHLVTARAVLRGLDQPAVLGHVSAAIAHGLPAWGSDLSTVHVIRPARRHGARVESGVAHHSATLPAEHLDKIDGIPVTSLARTLVDHARTTRFEPAVVTADAGLRTGRLERRDLLDMRRWQQDWPGARNAGGVVSFADGRSESVGESRGRVRIDEAGLPQPELQVEITEEDGRFVARVDYLFRAQRTIGEFDGRLKYRLASAGGNPEDALWREKLREDRLRSLGYAVVRITWADLERAPAWLRHRFLEAFARLAV